MVDLGADIAELLPEPMRAALRRQLAQAEIDRWFYWATLMGYREMIERSIDGVRRGFHVH